jgi:hypothetical protein
LDNISKEFMGHSTNDLRKQTVTKQLRVLIQQLLVINILARMGEVKKGAGVVGTIAGVTINRISLFTFLQKPKKEL